MAKMVTIYFGFLLLAMHSSQVLVQAQANVTMAPNVTAVGTSFSVTTMPVNSTGNVTIQAAGMSLQSSACTLLIPVALASSLLHGHF